VGSVVQSDLAYVLVRFCYCRYVISADVLKIYRQILVDPTQTSVQRILWRGDPASSGDMYELSTITYGTASASYLAISCLNHLAEQYSFKYFLRSASVTFTLMTCVEYPDVKDSARRTKMLNSKSTFFPQRIASRVRGQESLDFSTFNINVLINHLAQYNNNEVERCMCCSLCLTRKVNEISDGYMFTCSSIVTDWLIDQWDIDSQCVPIIRLDTYAAPITSVINPLVQRPQKVRAKRSTVKSTTIRCRKKCIVMPPLKG